MENETKCPTAGGPPATGSSLAAGWPRVVEPPAAAERLPPAMQRAVAGEIRQCRKAPPS